MAIVLLWLAFVALFLLLAWILLRGCGLAWPGSDRIFLSFCSAAAEPSEQLADLRAAGQGLEHRLRDLQDQVRTVPSCSADCALVGDSGAIDLYFLQDLSASFRDDLPNVKSMIDDLISRREAGELGRNVAIGLGAFIDKPLPGDSAARNDYVFRSFARLGASADELRKAAAGLQVGYGGTTAGEAQYEAIIEMLGAGAAVGFRPAAKRYVVLVTDAVALVAGDWPDAPAPEDGIADGDPLNEDYPSEGQVSAALRANDVTPIFIVTGPVEGFYRAFVERHGSGYVETISSSSENLTKSIFSSLVAACGRQPDDAAGR
ncbi:VWA domain-containing protein [Tistlia consotensis]|uniref:VWA domain-containing protein n=1 Tax=Tistlia consotensis TaxID=1321365 RepID=UPI0013562F79|nr:VWA domain-containing protein [Tistlia consotensis]